MAQSPPRTFLNSRRYGSDDCARECKDTQNDEMYGYNTYAHFHVPCDAPFGRQPDFQYDHVNLTARVGYGNTDACIVDDYSKLRHAPTRGKCHIQLFERIFQGCPNLRPGTANPDVEGPLVQGASAYEPCAKALFADFEYHLTPLVPCMRDVQNPDHLVERAWVRGGDDTRSFVRRQEFVKACAPEHLRRQRA